MNPPIYHCPNIMYLFSGPYKVTRPCPTQPHKEDKTCFFFFVRSCGPAAAGQKAREGIPVSFWLAGTFASCPCIPKSCAPTYHNGRVSRDILTCVHSSQLDNLAGLMQALVVLLPSPSKTTDNNQMSLRLGGLVFLTLSMAVILSSGVQNQHGSVAVNRPEALFQSLFLWASALLCFYDCLAMIAVYRNFEVKLDVNHR